MKKTELALVHALLPVLIGLASCATSPPNPPLPRSWRTPRPAAEVMRDAIHLPPEETNDLIAAINAKLKTTYGAGDQLSYESFRYEGGHLILQVNEGLHAMYGVELYRISGRWRLGRTQVEYE